MGKRIITYVLQVPFAMQLHELSQDMPRIDSIVQRGQELELIVFSSLTIEKEIDSYSTWGGPIFPLRHGTFLLSAPSCSGLHASAWTSLVGSYSYKTKENHYTIKMYGPRT